MPNPETKKNVRRFLEALLTYTSPESQGVHEERLAINFDWKESTGRLYPLVVRTTLKELEKLVPSDPTDGKLSQNQIRNVIQKYLSEKFLGILKDNREQPKGSKYWHFTLTLGSKDTQKNLLQFDQEWERLLKLPSPNSRSQPKGDINWQRVCRTYLQLHRSLASNVFSAGMGIRFALDELHIPLGLVERQQKSQHWEDSDPELGSRVYQEEKSIPIDIPIDYDDFFDRVLARGQSPKSEGSRLAIIGEPGAGKTRSAVEGGRVGSQSSSSSTHLDFLGQSGEQTSTAIFNRRLAARGSRVVGTNSGRSRKPVKAIAEKGFRVATVRWRR